MIKSVQIKLLTTITIIFLCTTESTKCPDYENIPSHDAEPTEIKTPTSAEQIATHNQNATSAMNKFLPKTAQQPIIDKPVTQDTMSGGLDLGKPTRITAPGDLGGGKDLGPNSFEITERDGSKAVKTNDPSSKTMTDVAFDKTGKKISTTISTQPVKSGWFSKTGTTTKIIHHADGTHTATTTTTTYSLFGKTSDVTVNKLNNQAETTATFKPGTKTSRGWDGSTTTTTVHADGSTSTQVKSLFGTPISASGNESNGSQINANAPYNVE